ncbi:hypothetical protein LUZ61_013532 [Rhynchospora tenuis]|uniref:PGG domain-containing protein n=1 Tax=Rhynchospora tenuis TaxID=198213 RepID=A0AAD5Z0U8_9POAL|nr:hypothetical protein LUZ61_013532 [Rhynchospora tenuis]
MATTEHRTVSPLLGVTHAGDTALHIATCFGHHDMAKRICEKNSFMFMQDNDKAETPLHYAAQAGNCKLVTLFIRLAEKEGGNVVAELLRKRNRDGETALFQAIHHCQVLEVDILRLYGKLKLLHFHFGNAKRAWADKNTHVEVVEELLRADFAVADCPNFRSMFQLASIPNNNGISPLYLAIMQNSLSTVTSLVGSLPVSASRVEYAGPDGRTALHAAAVRNKGFIQKVTSWKPELTKTTDNSGSTPLHYAVSANNLEGVKLLLETDKTSAYVADDSSLYPIHVAAKLGLELLVAEFFEQCPDSDELLDREGRNFLHLAVEERKASVVWWVCKRSKLVKVLNSQENKGDTPMHLAVKARDVNIFALLLGSQKTRTCIMNKNGLTPLDVAIANRTVGFWNWQNPNYIIERTLNWIGCSSGIHRIDNFISEHNLLMDQEKKEKEAQDLEKMAKSMAIGSTLIASAAFAGTFTVSIAYRRESNSSHSKPGLSLAFKAFVIMSAYAFICAIAATALVVEAALNFLDPEYRKKYVVICAQLVTEAIKGFIVAIALGVLVMMISVLQWRLACLICLICCVVPVLLQPHFWPNILIQRALIRYLGIKRFTLVGGHILIRNISYGIIVLLVLLAGRSSNTDLAEHIVLAIIIVILLFVSYPFIPSFGNIWIRSKAITIMIDKRFFIIIVLSLVTYMVLFFPMQEIKKSSKAT